MDDFAISMCLSISGVVIFIVQKGGCRAKRYSQAKNHLTYEHMQSKCPRGDLLTQGTCTLEMQLQVSADWSLPPA